MRKVFAYGSLIGIAVVILSLAFFSQYSSGYHTTEHYTCSGITNCNNYGTNATNVQASGSTLLDLHRGGVNLFNATNNIVNGIITMRWTYQAPTPPPDHVNLHVEQNHDDLLATKGENGELYVLTHRQFYTYTVVNASKSSVVGYAPINYVSTNGVGYFDTSEGNVRIPLSAMHIRQLECKVPNNNTMNGQTKISISINGGIPQLSPDNSYPATLTIPAGGAGTFSNSTNIRINFNEGDQLAFVYDTTASTNTSARISFFCLVGG